MLTGLTRSVSLDPDMNVRSTTLLPARPNQFNIITGASFTISCTATHDTPNFNVQFFSDTCQCPQPCPSDWEGCPLNDGDLPQTTMTNTSSSSTSRTITLTFDSFTEAHNGRYYCNATISDDVDPNDHNDPSEISGNSRAYGTGKSVKLVHCHCIVNSLSI